MRITKSDLNKLNFLNFLNRKMVSDIKGISIDSRTIKKGEIFIALKGDNFDGHDFIKNISEKEPSLIILNNERFEEFRGIKLPLLFVENTFFTLGQLANIYRKKFTGKIIAISGSNGKTTTKEMIANVLSAKYNVLKTEGNLNNYYGVPLTLFRLNNKYDVAIIEMGMNHPGELKYLAEIAEPDYGLLTNIGNAHIEFFGTINKIANAKGELFEYLAKHNKYAFINTDDKRVVKVASGIRSRFETGFNKNAMLKGLITALNNEGQPCLNLSYKNKSVLINLKTFGTHSAKAALIAAGIGIKFGISLNEIKKQLENFDSVSKRMEVIKAGNSILINDAYNANPDSMKAALESLKKISKEKTKVAVIGDMYELGKHSEYFHMKIARDIKRIGLETVFCFGEFTKITAKTGKEIGLNAKHYKTKDEIVKDLKKIMKNPSVILVKGSRKMKMEEIIMKLNELK